jgi:type II secretory pathway pseudopilin PulG
VKAAVKRVERRAFILADVAIGMAVVGVIAAVLAGAVGRTRAAEQRLADDRAAVRLAEHALLNLQHHQTAPTAPDGASINVRRATDPTGGAWAAVDVDLHGRRATLFGMLPEEAAK